METGEQDLGRDLGQNEQMQCQVRVVRIFPLLSMERRMLIDGRGEVWLDIEKIEDPEEKQRRLEDFKKEEKKIEEEILRVKKLYREESSLERKKGYRRQTREETNKLSELYKRCDEVKETSFYRTNTRVRALGIAAKGHGFSFHSKGVERDRFETFPKNTSEENLVSLLQDPSKGLTLVEFPLEGKRYFHLQIGEAAKPLDLCIGAVCLMVEKKTEPSQIFLAAKRLLQKIREDRWVEEGFEGLRERIFSFEKGGILRRKKMSLGRNIAERDFELMLKAAGQCLEGATMGVWL